MSAHHDWDLVKKKKTRAKALISLSLPWWQRMMRDEDQSIKALTKQQQMYVCYNYQHGFISYILITLL